MTPQESKDSLSRVPRASFVSTPPDSAAILLSNIRASENELAEIREWVEAQGGREESTASRPSRGLRAGGLIAAPSRSWRHFVVPIAALN